jgi:hypothetical protein
MPRPAKYDELIKYLMTQSGKLGKGTHNKEQRPWLDLQELSGGPVGNFDVDGLYKKMDREDANSAYVAARKDPNAVEHQIIVPKLAENFMAGCLRDFVDCRKRSRVRMMVHTGNRLRVDDQGVKSPLHIHTIGFLTAIEGSVKNGVAAPPEPD